MPEKPIMHGHDHRGGGMDRIPADWHYVGDSGEPAFQSGISNQGGTKAPLRFRFAPGTDFSGSVPQENIDIEGSITGGTDGDTIFTLPVTVDYDTYRTTVDTSGVIGAFTIQQSGDVVQGYV